MHVYRETDWLFSSDGGRKQLAESAGFERLVVVTLHRAHTYTGVEGVREEVGGRAVQLVQGGVAREKQVRDEHASVAASVSCTIPSNMHMYMCTHTVTP